MMETNKPICTLVCLQNGEDVSHCIHSLKYGVNTIGRGLNNDIILKNLNVSRTHCHLRVEKKESKDIAYIKDLGTSNGTMVRDINLTEFEEHQLNNLDMIILASGVEGVVLKFIDHIDQTVEISNSSNNSTSNKRKVLSVENSDDNTAVKMPKLALIEKDLLKETFSNINSNLSNKLNNSPIIANNISHETLNQSTSSGIVLKSVNDSKEKIFSSEKLPQFSLINTKTSCSRYNSDTLLTPENIKTEPSCSRPEINVLITSVKIKTQPETINNIASSQGTYRKEEDSVIIIFSSDEENDIDKNNSEFSSSITKPQEHMNSIKSSTKNDCPSTSMIKSNYPEWNIHCQRNEIVSDDENAIIDMPPKIVSNVNNVLLSSSDNDSDYNSKFAKIIEPLSLKHKKRNQTKTLSENENIIKTRAKSEKRINNKKKAAKVTADQNKQIIQERRVKLQQLVKNKPTTSTIERQLLQDDSSTNDNFIDKPSTTDILKKRTRVSRVQQQQVNNYNCIPSTSRFNLATEIEKNGVSNIKKSVNFICKEKTPKINSQNLHKSSLSKNNLNSSLNSRINSPHFAYFDTLSKICKWNAVWLQEEKFVDQSPPLTKPLNKMKGLFENLTEYSSIVKPLLLYEIWSKISESYNMVLSKDPILEKCIFEKSLQKDIPLLTFDIQSVNKDFSSSESTLRSINEPLWCLKCVETRQNKMFNKNTLIRSSFSLKGCLCIVIIQSKHFETDAIKVKKPTKSRNIFFAYVNIARKIGFYSNAQQLYIELIVTKKTENIPTGTLIHLMDLTYLHSELRLFQAINHLITSPLCNALITPQLHNYTLDYSKSNIKYNISGLTLNNSQKEAVKMAVTICLSKEPNVGLIIGPPGTGKTNVICNIVLTLVSKPNTIIKTKSKLLVCAPSNEAVDAIVRRLLEIQKEIKSKIQFDVVRVGGGHKYDAHSPIADVMLDTLVKQRMNDVSREVNSNQGQSNILSIFSNKKDVERDILQNSDIVVTTLNSCFSKTMEDAFSPSANKVSNSCHFMACIVDEAGQCVEPLNYVPILLGVDKLILVGDDKQLQPVVKSKPAKDYGFGISLLKRLKTWFEHSRDPRKKLPITMLDTQYRMHHDICLFPSEYFYKGLVKTAPSVKARKLLPFQPYVILEHESQQDSTGEINIGEANMIVTLVEILLNSECNSLTIAVLTPYHKQREQINTLLEIKNISLNVNTIDSFQGSECDVLLISTVRTNGIGFLDDICRLNVALTRAKQSLIVCGNFKSLKGEKLWCDLLENAKKRKLLKKVSKHLLTNSKHLFTLIKY